MANGNAEAKPAEYDVQQQQAVQRALHAPVSIITGGPGTGKTTVCREIIKRFRMQGKRVVCAAPTGKASHRLADQTGYEASTIHRLLEWSNKEMGFVHNNMNPLMADVVIIDETSMVDVTLMASLLDAVATGTRLILVGDANQLPPVGPGSVLRDTIDAGTIPVTRLTTVHRFGSEWLTENANRIQRREPLYLDRANNDDFFFMKRERLQHVVDIVLNIVTRRVPQLHKLDPINDVQVLCPMKKTEIGVNALNAQLREALNPETEDTPTLELGYVDKDVPQGYVTRKFRLGDKVMQMRNNYNLYVFNGEVGQITGIDPDEEVVQVTFDGPPRTYGRAALRDLKLAYASTVHKSQGSEYPCVVLVIHSVHGFMLYRALLYTGITRAKKYVYIVGNRRGLGQALSNDRPVLRRTCLAERLSAAEVPRAWLR